MLRDCSRDDRHQPIAVFEAQAFVALKTHSEFILYSGYLPTDLQGFKQAAPLTRRNRANHHTPAIGGLKVTPERTVQIIAQTITLPAEHARLGDVPQIAEGA
jgi:hypothetical protein